MRPETAAMFQRRLTGPPPDSCTLALIPGIPLAGLLSEPIKIVQAPQVTMVVYEVGGHNRQIFTDGRTLPREFDLPAYYGYSVGRWQGETPSSSRRRGSTTRRRLTPLGIRTATSCA